jgi:hypothetical protein
VFCDLGVGAPIKMVLSYGASSVDTWSLSAPTRTIPQGPKNPEDHYAELCELSRTSAMGMCSDTTQHTF